MKKLWVFGDSFSGPFTFQGWWQQKYCELKGYIPKYFGEVIAEELNLELKSCGGYGCNSTILHHLLDKIDEIEEGDIIMMGWTDIARYRVANPCTHDWTVIYPSRPKDALQCEFSEKSLNEFSVNRMHPLYINEHKNIIKLIDKGFVNNWVFHWDWCKLKNLGCETLNEETNGIIEDGHWSEFGHKKFADWFLDLYRNNKKINIYE